MSNTLTKTLINTLQEYVPYYLAKYVEWYMSDPKKRCKWEELVVCDQNFRIKTNEVKNEKEVVYKTEKFCEENWLPRTDVQEAMRAYLKYFKTQSLTKLYKSMLDKALSGDVRAADWVVKFSQSDFFDDSTDELESFLNGVDIPALKKE